MRPIPVWLGAGVVAFRAQGALVQPDEAAVVGEEEAREVHQLGVENVRGDEVFVARARAGDEGRVGEGGLLGG